MSGRDKTDWSRCIVCQEVKPSQKLQCPADTKRQSDAGAGYSTLAANIQKFHELGCLPTTINPSRLDEGNGIENTLVQNNAKWHKSCYMLFNATKLKRAEKKQRDKSDQAVTQTYTRSSSSNIPKSAATCFFCDKIGTRSKPLRNVSTFGLDSRVRASAFKLHDEKLLTKLSQGTDLIALEAKYHPACLVQLYKKADSLNDAADQNEDEICPESIALAELVAYIEESSESVFKLADLAKVYQSRLRQLDCPSTARINSTRLKERILTYIPNLEDYCEGRDVYLAFREKVGKIIRGAHLIDSDEEAIHLAKAANIVRKDMLTAANSFSAHFDANCQENSVPKSLLSLINMILYGPNIETQSCNLTANQPAVTIAQLLQYNCYARRRGIKQERKKKSRETPVAIYTGLVIHSKTRSREVVETMYNLGLSVSYDRILSISTSLGNAVCHHYQQQNVVCPSNLRNGLFTTAAVDNIDHNPSSTTAQDSFHGTGISIFQNLATEKRGTAQQSISISETTAPASKTVEELPDWYTNITPVALPNKTPSVPDGCGSCNGSSLVDIPKEEILWLETVKSHLDDENSSNPDTVISWAGYHYASQQPRTHLPAVSALLPLFPDNAKSVAMIAHAMDVIKSCVNHLNPKQVPVIALDQPLYAVAKQIQWNFKEKYGEDKFVIMFGGLHIEMAFLKLIGSWLDGCGWTTALVDANVASSGTAESFIKATSVTRSRRAHQVTASCLYILLKKAYDNYIHEANVDDEVCSFHDWCSHQATNCPQFYYWYTAFKLQLILLMFVRSIRLGDFSLYREALSLMLPWLFALNHTNYARWIPVHLRDMCLLPEISPDVAAEFKQGSFTVRKSTRHFSAIAIDHAHEQNNAIVKGDGGAVGLTENAGALRRWMTSGPEIARLVNEFELNQPEDLSKHHEVQKSFQTSFGNDVKSLVATFEELGNPFLDESDDLVTLDTREVAPPDALERLKSIETKGKSQCDEFVLERLEKREESIFDPIKRNKLSFFTSAFPKKTTKFQQQLYSVKSDCALFSRLYISCQTRDGDLDDFFMHENQGCPPSLSNQGKLRLPKKKSELIDCLVADDTAVQSTKQTVNVTIIDGAVAVNMIRPSKETTFEDYALKSFLPYIEAQSRLVDRIDVVWDVYVQNSLKHTTRCNRGIGVRRRISASSPIPRKWDEFLRMDENKSQLFKFLAEYLSTLNTEKQVITTFGEQVLCTVQRDLTCLAPCSHEEADTRIILHVQDAIDQGYTKITIRTVDTDVLVLAVAALPLLSGPTQPEIWLAFGTGANLRYIAAHTICANLGPRISKALPFFHAFTGCDTVSCFAGKGKKTAFEVWKLYPEVTDSFLLLASEPQEVNESCMRSIERFTVLLYDRTSNKSSVNEARKQLFAQKGRSLEAIPPSRAALVEHTKRAAYQAGHCWGQAFKPRPVLPSPESWGWIMCEGKWEPYWTTLPDVTKVCRELVRCGCKKGCKGRCSCLKVNLRCTALCSCDEECNNR